MYLVIDVCAHFANRLFFPIIGIGHFEDILHYKAVIERPTMALTYEEVRKNGNGSKRALINAGFDSFI